MKKINHRQSAKRTLNIEAEALTNLSNNLNHDFTKLCNYLLACKGKIITLGVGKSGHIAQKISATLASTGSPSYFIHATEAQHGDIGIVSKKDSVLLISHSGESKEIIDLIPSLKKIGCKIFSFTGKMDSTIAKKTNINISTEVETEACPLDLAPTSSTTATLALGDALAIALLESREFSPKDFAKSHPGGKLGKKLTLTVKDIMHKGEDFPKVRPTALLSNALLEISKKGLGIVAVVYKKKLEGVFTDGDLRRSVESKIDLHNTKISSVMSKKAKTIEEESLAIHAAKIMQDNQIYVLIVMNSKRSPVGVIRMHDLMLSGLV
ncbi:MAG: D-arabinose 5-phosphate isomerase [Gammaproteobacteria bacterium]|nr:D-arabinose 5-phosphate isomerase [Gammaproteobacteria bacterium]|tara:strand:- start:2902 stop:3870 length:969 start_codon:yes stop_codon:yes gene_type:complete